MTEKSQTSNLSPQATTVPVLPISKTTPKVDIGMIRVLIYGAPKLGKSTFCAEVPDALYCYTEDNVAHLQIYPAPTNSWVEFTKYMNLLATTQHNYRAIVIDTIDNLYRFCQDYVCESKGVKHESDIPWGKGTALIMNEFQRVLTKVSQMGLGMYMVSHIEEKKINSRTGDYVKWFPTLPRKAVQFITGFVNMILFCDVEERVVNGENTKEHTIRLKPSKFYEAGGHYDFGVDNIPLSFRTFHHCFETKAVLIDVEKIREKKSGKRESEKRESEKKESGKKEIEGKGTPNSDNI